MGTDDLGVLTEKVPIGKWVANAIEFIKDNFFHELRAFSDAIGWLLDAFAYFLALISPPVLIFPVAGVAFYLHRSVVLVIGLLLILDINYWGEMLFTVGLGSWPRPPSARAFRRHAAARGSRARVRHRCRNPADGRALLSPRSAVIRERMRDELLALQQTLRRTILFVSHDLDEAPKIGPRITIMEGGRIVHLGLERRALRPCAQPGVRGSRPRTDARPFLPR